MVGNVKILTKVSVSSERAIIDFSKNIITTEAGPDEGLINLDGTPLRNLDGTILTDLNL